MVQLTLSLSATPWLDFGYLSFNIAQVVLGLKLSSVTLVTAIWVLFSLVYLLWLVNPPIRRLKLFVKFWINMKSYYNFMFLRTMCSSFKSLPTQKNMIWPYFKSWKIGWASFSKFWHVSPSGMHMWCVARFGTICTI